MKLLLLNFKIVPLYTTPPPPLPAYTWRSEMLKLIYKSINNSPINFSRFRLFFNRSNRWKTFLFVIMSFSNEVLREAYRNFLFLFFFVIFFVVIPFWKIYNSVFNHLCLSRFSLVAGSYRVGSLNLVRL